MDASVGNSEGTQPETESLDPSDDDDTNTSMEGEQSCTAASSSCSSLPLPIAFVNAILSAGFQIPMLPLLYILNTRVSIPAKYLPAYGAIAFLPLSLRPLMAYGSSYLLIANKEEAKHGCLLAPALFLGAVAHIGTASIPEHGIRSCFLWGFLRGMVNAYLDWLLGMVNIELAAHTRHSTYEQLASVFTAQSQTAKNLGSLLSSVFAFGFYLLWNDPLNDSSVSFLLYLTAFLYATAACALLWHNRFGGGGDDVAMDLGLIMMGASPTSTRDPYRMPYESIQSDAEVEHRDDSKLPECGGEQMDSSFEASRPIDTQLEFLPHYDDATKQASLETAALLVFQLLLATSSLRQLLVAWMGLAFWAGLVAILLVTLVAMTILLLQNGEILEQQECHRAIPYYRLNLYFLLRNSLPTSITVLYSFQYFVFAKEPFFLQVLWLCGSLVSTIAAHFYERFLTPFHNGWPLIGLIATLDILSGLVSLLDLIVIRSVPWDSDHNVSSIRLQFRILCATVAAIKGFAAELDYLPSAVLSAVNVKDVSDDKQHEDIGDGVVGWDNIVADVVSQDQSWSPRYGRGVQYASFLSSIDFGFQVAEWISIPLLTALKVTRDHEWANLDDFVLLCSVLRMFRPFLLWLLIPREPVPAAFLANDMEREHD